jgi:hypothetical protein
MVENLSSYMGESPIDGESFEYAMLREGTLSKEVLCKRMIPS